MCTIPYNRNSVIWPGVLLLFQRIELYCTFRDEQPTSCIQIISRSWAITLRVTKANRQRNENGRWKANSGTRLRHDVVHGDICRAPEFVDRATVTARLRFSLLHSKTVTLSSQSSPLEVHGASIPRFTFWTNGNCALLGLKLMSNVDTILMSILQTITAAFNGTSRLMSAPKQVSAPIKIRAHYETITVCS